MADRFSTNWDTKSVSKADSVAYLGRFFALVLGHGNANPFLCDFGVSPVEHKEHSLLLNTI